MKKLSILLGLLFLASCSKDDIITEYENSLEQNISEVDSTETTNTDTPNTNDTSGVSQNGTSTEYQLYKQSILNQRSGITWIWGDWDNTPITNPWPSYFSAGQSYLDVNNDGLMDVLLSAHAEDNTPLGTHFYLNNGMGGFIKNESYINQSTLGLSSHKILKTDINHDKYPDFVLLGVDETEPGNMGGNFSSLVSDENGKYNVIRIAEGKGGYYYHNGAAGDFNGDGEVDVVTATFIWYGDGTGNFVKRQGTTMDYYMDSSLCYEAIDVNKDGWDDIVIATKTRHGKTTIVLNNNGIFDENNQTIKLSKIDGFEEIMDFEVYDIDGDNDLDIIESRQKSWGDQGIPENFGSELFVYLNNNMNFTYTKGYIQNSEDGNYVHGKNDKFGWSTFKFDDIDGDGIDEILAENYHDGVYNGLKKINNKWEKIKIKFGN